MTSPCQKEEETLLGAQSLCGTWAALAGDHQQLVTAVWEPVLISPDQDIKVLEPDFEELAASSQTRHARLERERKT